MRFGVNVNFTDLAAIAPQARDVGLDYVELRVSDTISPQALDDDEFAVRRQAILQLGVPVEAANVFVSPPLYVVGPAVDLPRFRVYASKVIERLEQLGVSILVWGSGPTRRIPEGFAHGVAVTQFRDHVAVAAEVAERRGITIALEALPRTAVNFLNRLDECAAIALSVGSSAVGLVADNLHMMKEETDYLVAMRASAHLIRHVHVADSNGRPPTFGGGYDFGPFAATLRALGYDRRVSIEARIDLTTELGEALGVVRRLMR